MAHLVLINPLLSVKVKQTFGREGCCPVPALRGKNKRADAVRVDYQGIDGRSIIADLRVCARVFT